VDRTIKGYWLSSAGRARFQGAVERADRNGYTEHIVKTLQRHGLPPQFFYMAMQESNLNPRAIGPPTRWGRAKGMWQFIPATARRFGLNPGTETDSGGFDPRDERHDVVKATDAAARYLNDIYGTLAQASGLLVVASYNWGEHRITNKLERLTGPQSIPMEALEGIPENPNERNYWRFLVEYKDRMPDETKDYVLKIFAAAVIGENPRLFDLDMDNPLSRYVETRFDTSQG
jgi:soluble lytic murein transglycosylase-like protein